MFIRNYLNKKKEPKSLSITQEIINLHKGKIVVEKNKNTINFTISF